MPKRILIELAKLSFIGFFHFLVIFPLRRIFGESKKIEQKFGFFDFIAWKENKNANSA